MFFWQCMFLIHYSRVDCWHMPTLPFSFGIVYVWTMHKIFICIYTTLVCTRILPKPELSELFSLLCCHFLKVKNAYKLMTILIDMNVYYQVNKKFIINEINFNSYFKIFHDIHQKTKVNYLIITYTKHVIQGTWE